MATIKRKVFAYITHGDRLLIFRHRDAPEAGLQVPAGTVEPGEKLDDAVVREAFEETGLVGLRLAHYLGERWRDMSDYGLDQLHQRFFYHLEYAATPPETWSHVETDPSDGSEQHVFEFFWARLPDDVPALTGDHDQMLGDLWAALRSTA